MVLVSVGLASHHFASLLLDVKDVEPSKRKMMKMATDYLRVYLQTLACVLFTTTVVAQDTEVSPWAGRQAQLNKVEKMFGDPPGMTRIDKVSRVWADRKTQRVVVDGYIALRKGQLEMLACPVGTKEHESIIAVFSKAQIVHAALLAIGAKPGKPVSWEPKYQPPTGSEIQVFVLWTDEQGKKKSTDARKWVHEVGTKDGILQTNFIFAGSQMWKDPDTGEESYQAESGDLICVSNFQTATLDIPMESSKVNAGLMFAAASDSIPPTGTPVRLVLQLVNEGQKKSVNIDKSALQDISGDPNSNPKAVPR
jgi:hypothetical protein